MTKKISEVRFTNDLTVTSGPIEVRCYSLDDRVGHSLFFQLEATAGNALAIELLRSVEGDSLQDNPPSGPMQEIVSEVASVGKAPVLMGLGSAGKSTWSCSIEGDATIESVAFDFACKTRSTEFIGSTYELMSGVVCDRVDANIAVLAVNGQRVCLRSFGDARLLWDESANTITVVAPLPHPDLPAAQKNQRRWRYVVGLYESLVFASDAVGKE